MSTVFIFNTAIGCALVVALLAGTIVLFQTQVLWDMSSPNAMSWNATLNGTATGFGMTPIFVVIVLMMVVLGLVATTRGFG